MHDRYSTTPSEYAREYYKEKKEEKERRIMAERGKIERERPLTELEIKKYKKQIKDKMSNYYRELER